MTEPVIRRISGSETIAIRWPVLRAGYPCESAVFDGDNAPETQHIGAFLGEQLVGVASLFLVPCPTPQIARAWQLRGMATLPEVRGRGVGRALLCNCEAIVRATGDHVLWCNAASNSRFRPSDRTTE